jgi:hypothetical protein
MIRHKSDSGLFADEFLLKSKEGETVNTSSSNIVQFDTGAEDGNYCSEEFAKLAEAAGYKRANSNHRVQLADGLTSLSLSQEILVDVTLLFGALGREDKLVRIRCVILPKNALLSYDRRFGYSCL